MNFEKIDDEAFEPIFDTKSDCNCHCQGTEMPFNEGLKNMTEGTKQKGSCIT